MYREKDNSKAVFENRYDAGTKLAEKLKEYSGQDVIVLAIPNGGVPIATPVALALDCALDFVISRKLPIPLRPEGGFGAVADDGSYILYPEMVRAFGITEEQIDSQVQKVRAHVRERSLRFRAGRPIAVLTGKIAIIVDDGLASGYTMLAAVESVRRRRPKQIVVAIPTASSSAVKLLEKTADRVVSLVIDCAPSFFVSKYYRYWDNPQDEETLNCIEDYHRKRGYAQLSASSSIKSKYEESDINHPNTALSLFRKHKENVSASSESNMRNQPLTPNGHSRRYPPNQIFDQKQPDYQASYNEAKRRFLTDNL